MSDHDVSAELFHRAAAHAAAFRAGLDDKVQRPESSYAALLAKFQAPTPETGSPAAEVLDDLVALATPGIHASTGRRFFGWVIGSSHPMGVAADIMTSAWGQNAGNHMTSPASAACEAVACDWLLDILDLPRHASVGLATGATLANFVGLAAARGEVLRRIGWDVEADGLFGAPPIRVLIGEEAHSTVFTALKYLGLGQARVTKIAVDDQGAIRADAFDEAMAACRDDPAVIVITQAGQINTGAIDPHREIVAAARRHPNVWIHVDGAFGLWARACPELGLGDGIDGADSWGTDGHKWLQTPYDSGFTIVRDSDAHRRAMTIAASYLPAAGIGERDPSQFVPELSRRARGFAVYAMIRHLGRRGISDMVARHCRLTRLFADLVSNEKGIRVENEVTLNQLVLRFGADLPDEAGDALTRATITALQKDGTFFAGGTLWHGRWMMRISIIGSETTDDDVRRSAEAVLRVSREVRP